MSTPAQYSSADRVVTAYFDDRTHAEKAVRRLTELGLPASSIRLTQGADKAADRKTAKSGFWASLSDLFLPDEDRDVYAEGLSRGGFVVSAHVTEAQYDAALDILDDDGTIDLGERQESWRTEGWTDRSETVAAKTGGAEASIPIAEESIRIGKRDVNNGRVRVRSYVVEEPVSENVTLRNENVGVERRTVDRAATATDELFKERTIELEEHSEEAVVAKDVRVTEELVVTKDVSERTEKVSDSVRKTRVEVEDERGAKSDQSKRGA